LAQLQQDHVVSELECIDRMYLNAYVPKLTSEAGIAAFCRGYLGHRFASTKQAVDMTKAFIKSIDAFIQREGLELVRFRKGQRKDDILQKNSAPSPKTKVSSSSASPRRKSASPGPPANALTPVAPSRGLSTPRP